MLDVEDDRGLLPKHMSPSTIHPSLHLACMCCCAFCYLLGLGNQCIVAYSTTYLLRYACNNVRGRRVFVPVFVLCMNNMAHGACSMHKK
jgi:hypothetical protein